jgi:GNAT superfamily N-acetyltransferase
LLHPATVVSPGPSGAGPGLTGAHWSDDHARHPGPELTGPQLAACRAAPGHADGRAGGLGHALFSWAISEARRRGCALVQLTSDKTRADAHRFYTSLGFTATHEGLKLPLV